MNAHDELSARLRELFLERLRIEVPSTDADLIDQGLLDSLSLVELLVQLEQEFQVTVSLEELEIDDFRSVRSISRLVAARLQK